jgi:cyclopropane-fatty-acyl-phospholipid synthase
MHGDLFQAGKVAASELLQKKCDLLVNPKPMVPSWTEAGARFLVARNFERYMTIGNVR